MTDLISRLRLTPKDSARLWSKIDRKSDDQCWEWQAARFRTGYGHFSLGRKGYTAHRAVWIDIHGDPGSGDLEVCHTCDNRACCNPQHLFLGTSKTNAIDKVLKNRAARFPGERNQSARLKEAQVVDIRTTNDSHASTARKYGVSEAAVRAVRKRDTWQHLP